MIMIIMINITIIEIMIEIIHSEKSESTWDECRL